MVVHCGWLSRLCVSKDSFNVDERCLELIVRGVQAVLTTESVGMQSN